MGINLYFSRNQKASLDRAVYPPVHPFIHSSLVHSCIKPIGCAYSEAGPRDLETGQMPSLPQELSQCN